LSRVIERTPVAGSSNIVSVGFDPASGEMTVVFKGGGVYSVADVSQQEYDAFMAASSKGSAYHSMFKFTKTVTRL
jgi:hypothetical protein